MYQLRTSTTSLDDGVLTKTNTFGSDFSTGLATRSTATNSWSQGVFFGGDPVTEPWPS